MKRATIVLLVCIVSSLSYRPFSSWYHNSSKDKFSKTLYRSQRSPANEQSCKNLVLEIYNKKLSDTSLIQVQNLLKEFNVPTVKIETVNSYEDAIKVQYEHIIKTGRGVSQSDQMANFGKKIRLLYINENLNIEAIKDLDLTLGLRIIRAEQYLQSEYKFVKDNSYALGRNTKMIHADYTKFKEYTLSFEGKTPPYSTFDLSGGTVISLNDFRGIEAHNLFPVYIPHDMTHISYALHHERYFPVLFSAARSKNHLRYVMMAALSEGVDTVQFIEEIAITKYFRDIKKLDNEEGLLWLSRANTEELNAVADAIGHRQTFINLASNFKNWAPTVSKNHPSSGVTGVGFEQEVEDMATFLKNQHNDPDLIKRYKNRKSEIQVYTGDQLDSNPDAAELK